ncbi:hypothetical protein HD597_004382 [Nonomuraea thailandensis]|uniref:Transposase n=1 Tax=Nonomuraea thailandensis TaxID=1188745 RepID=A0A9X2GEM4_9ACTN|nr:hypothetical protein [Nonomuraea thailandensis]
MIEHALPPATTTRSCNAVTISPWSFHLEWERLARQAYDQIPPDKRLPVADAVIKLMIEGIPDAAEPVKTVAGVSGPARTGIDVEVVARRPDSRGFQVVKRRWVVERSLGRLMLYRRSARDYEPLPTS